MLPSTRFFAGLTLGGATLVALASLFAPVFVTVGPALHPVVEPWLKLVALICGFGLGALLLPIAVRGLLAGADSGWPHHPVLAQVAGPGGDRLVLAGWAIYITFLVMASPELAAFVRH